MLKIPLHIKKSYDDILISNGATSNDLIHYNKWLRFYLDFCFKYQHEPSTSTSLGHFIQKLTDKRQAPALRKQAKHAISFYYSLITDSKDISQEPSANQHNVSAIKRTCSAKQTDNLAIPPSKPAVRRTTAHVPAQIKNTSVNEPLAIYTPVAATKEISVKDIPPSSKRKNGGSSWVDVYESLAGEIKLRHYSPKTLKAYGTWIYKFQSFLKSKDPKQLTQEDVKSFLTYLAVEKKVAASTQNQAFNALLFLYKQVLNIEFGTIKGIIRAKKTQHIPVVLSRDEVDRVISHLPAPFDLAIKLMYGCGLRINECLSLRVKDFNFDTDILTIHNGKKDRTLPLPLSIKAELKQQIEFVINLHEEDCRAGYSGTFLPDSLEKKFPNAPKELIWQWFFPAKNLTAIEESEELRRYHIHDSHLQKTLKKAVNLSKLLKRATSHSFRHSFASHLLQANYDIHTIQILMGHSDIRTTLVYLKTVPSVTLKDAKSPLDL